MFNLCKDERSILFERERLRLRKAVQESTSSSIANGQNNTNDGTNDAFKGAAGGAHKNAYQTMKTPEVSARGAAANSSLRKNSPEKERSSITTPAPSIPQSPSKKIYAWEEKESSSADQIKERSTLVIDGANFVPAKEAGIYLRDNELTADVGLGTKENLKSMDMFVVLTADEINLLASRMLHSKAKDKSIFKNAYSQMGVQHSTPYVDPSRVMAGLLRPEQPQKWVDKNSLRPNAK